MKPRLPLARRSRGNSGRRDTATPPPAETGSPFRYDWIDIVLVGGMIVTGGRVVLVMLGVAWRAVFGQ